MTSISDKRAAAEPAGEPLSARILVPQMWATLAIVAMWLAVLFDGVFGGDIVSVNSGSNSTSVPSAVVVAFFAFLATTAVAKRAWGRPNDDRS